MMILFITKVEINNLYRQDENEYSVTQNPGKLRSMKENMSCDSTLILI